MAQMADILAAYGEQYIKKYQDKLLPSHLQAIEAILQCRTEKLGGHLFYCHNCQKEHYSYHSCKNRNCPKCQNETSHEWLVKQKALLLPVTYFLVTFTIPEPLRKLTRSNQKILYNILFQTSAQALQTLAKDPKYLGGEIGMVGVLHTWTRQLHYHPHIHYVIPGCALLPNEDKFLFSKDKFLMPVKALSVIFRAKFRDALKEHPELFNAVDKQTWKKPWVVHSKNVGTGERALEYMARYLNRIAISNHNIIKLENGSVTFRYKDAETGEKRYQTIPVFEFLRRFLQHVLPKRFVKIRYYGWLSPANRKKLDQLRKLMLLPPPENVIEPPEEKTAMHEREMHCPQCGRLMIWKGVIPRKTRHPP